MATQDWSIKIIPFENSVTFEPDFPGAQPGQPLHAQDADLVSWNNRTGADHWPWAIDPSTGQPFQTKQAATAAGLYLCDDVQAWQSSDPAYLCVAPKIGNPPVTINYICRYHPDETGQIIVSASA